MLKNIISGFLLTVVAIVILFIVAHNWIFKVGIEQGVGLATGFPTTVKSINYDFPSTVHIQGLKIENPKGFQEKVFVDIPEIYVDLVFAELLSGKKLHFREVRLNIQQVNIEKNSAGISNVEQLSSVGGKAPQAEKPKAEPAAKKEPMPFLLEKLVLSIRKVSYNDNSPTTGKLPTSKLAVDLNVNNEVFANLDSPATVINLITWKVVKGASLGNLLNLNPEKLLGDSAGAILSSGTALVTDQAAALQAQASGLASKISSTGITEATDDTLSSANTAMTEGTQAVQQKVSGLLGKLGSKES